MYQVVGHQVLEQADLPYWDSSEVRVVSMSILSCLNLMMKIFLGDTVSLSWFFSNYCGCPCVGFTSLRWMIKTKPWLLTLLHWNVIKMYSAYISWVVDGPPSVSAIPGLTSSLNKIKAQENEGTLITWIRIFERTRYISKWDGGTASMCFAWCSTATVQVVCIWTFNHLICGVLIQKKNKVFLDIPVQCGLIPVTAIPWTALDGYCSSRPPSV